MDRALYVWGCSRGECQKKEGRCGLLPLHSECGVLLILIVVLKDSVRAWRGLRYNKEYASKLKKKAMKQQEQQNARLSQEKKHQEEEMKRKINPFSVSLSCLLAKKLVT